MKKADMWAKLCELQEESKSIGKVKKFDVKNSKHYRMLVNQSCLANEIYREFIVLWERNKCNQ